MLGPDPESFNQSVLNRILRGGEVLPAPNQPGQHLGRQGPDELIKITRSPFETGQAITSRTSIHSYSGLPPGPGSEET